MQCAPCNTHLSGNAVLYRRALLAKIGIELVEWLEGHHAPRRDTVDDLKAIKTDYTAKTKQLKGVKARPKARSPSACGTRSKAIRPC